MCCALIFILPLVFGCAEVHAGDSTVIDTSDPVAEAEIEGRAVAILCQEYDLLAVEFPQASLEDLLCERRRVLFERLANQHIPPTVGVLGRLSRTHERFDGPLFAQAVVRHGLEDQCRTFPLLREQRALEIVCEATRVPTRRERPVPGFEEGAASSVLADRLSREGLSEQPVIGALAAASVERRPVIFTEAVQRYGLASRCEGSALYLP